MDLSQTFDTETALGNRESTLWIKVEKPVAHLATSDGEDMVGDCLLPMILFGGGGRTARDEMSLSTR